MESASRRTRRVVENLRSGVCSPSRVLVRLVWVAIDALATAYYGCTFTSLKEFIIYYCVSHIM